MHQRKYIQLLLTIIYVCINQYSYVTGTRATCADSILCTCEEKQSALTRNTEFRTICKGNGRQVLTLGAELFQDEPVDNTRSVYVRAENFLKLKVEEEFIKKWQYYSSSSLDIWYCNHVYMPDEVSVENKSEVASVYQVFGGIGIVNSSLHHLPVNMMNGRQASGVKLLRSKISSMNIKEFLGNAISLNYLILNGSDVGVLEGSTSSTIPLTYLSATGHPQIRIENTHIGIIEEGALQLKEYSFEDARLNIHSSFIGLVESHSVHIPQGVSLSVDASSIGMMRPNAIVNEGTTSVDIKNNTIGVVHGALTDVRCSAGVVITHNNFVPLDVTCNDPNCSTKEVDNYVHTSCEINTLLPNVDNTTSNQKELTNSTDRINVVEGSTRTPKSGTNTTIGKNYNTRNNYTSEGLVKRRVIPMGLFYVVSIIALILLLAIAILVGMLVWARQKNRTYRSPPVTVCNNTCEESNIYEEPVYFAPSQSTSYSRTTDIAPPEVKFQNVDRIRKDSSNSFDIRPSENMYVTMK